MFYKIREAIAEWESKSVVWSDHVAGTSCSGKTSLRHGFMNEPLPDKANSTVLAHTRPVKHYWVKSGRHSVCYWAEMSEEDEISENLQLFHQYRTSLTDVKSTALSLMKVVTK